MNQHAIMFDLDGTLADTLADIAAAANHALATLDQPTYDIPRYRHLAGQGLESLMVEALDRQNHHLIHQGCELFRQYYKEHSLDFTKPYDGIPDLLDTLTRQNATMAILSNKPHPATQQVVRDVLGRWSFAAVQGHQPPTPVKPDPTSALQLAKALSIEPSRWVFVGDTRVDMETAVNAGFHPVGVTWGFRTEEELLTHGARTIIHHPLDLLDFLKHHR